MERKKFRKVLSYLFKSSGPQTFRTASFSSPSEHLDIWRLRFDEFENEFPQYLHGNFPSFLTLAFMFALPNECSDFMCSFSSDKLSNFFSHNPH